MGRNLIFLLLLLPLLAPAADTILVMGDSLSAAHGIELEQGWVHLLRVKLDQTKPGNTRWRVINASVSGETTTGGLKRIPGLLHQYQPSLCIIGLGANDGLRGQSIEQLRLNLTRMITRCKKYGAVLLLGMKLPPNYGRQYAHSFERSFVLAAGGDDAALVPFFLNGIATREDYMQADGLHPAAAAQPLILENIWPSLVRLLESL